MNKSARATMNIFVFLLLVFASFLYSADGKKWTVTATGCVRCYGKPVPYVLAQLYDDDFLFDDHMATVRTNKQGCFRMTGKAKDGIRGKPDPYVKVEYSYAGYYGKMKVSKLLGRVRSERSKKRKYRRRINFGYLNDRSIHCKAYVEFYKAMVDYRKRTNLQLPYKELNVRTNVFVHGGTPYALRSMVRIPRKYKSNKLTFDTAQHELAHTVRHTYDGSLAHFLGDAVKYNYFRRHNCGKRTNHGFAFNEGWALFWENGCHGNYGKSSKDYRYEGNVAKALRKLKNDCRSSDRKFVLILKKNKKRIHSFNHFNSYHRKHYGCYLR